METDKAFTGANGVSEDWCPLFGSLPAIDYDPGMADNECMETIITARAVWEVNPFRDFIHRCPKYCESCGGVFQPVPADLPNYAVNACLSAKTILEAWSSLKQQYGYPSGDIRTFDDNKCIPNGNEWFRWDLAVEGMRGSSVWGYFDDSIPDFAVIAGFALSESWGTLDLIFSGESPNSTWVWKSIYFARALLRKAEDDRTVAERAASKRFRRNKFVMAGKQKGKSYDRSYQKWSSTAKAIKIGNPEISIRELAIEVVKRLHPKLVASTQRGALKNLERKTERIRNFLRREFSSTSA